MRMKNVRQLIISTILGSAVFAAVGCSVSMTSNTTSNSNANSAAGNTAANKSNTAPANTNTTAQNTSPANTEQKSNANVATKPADSDEKGDCTVKADDTEFFIVETEKSVKLKKGASIQYIQFGNQGLAVVKAQVDGKWVQGEIQDDAIDCPSDEKDEPAKR